MNEIKAVSMLLQDINRGKLRSHWFVTPYLNSQKCSLLCCETYSCFIEMKCAEADEIHGLHAFNNLSYVSRLMPETMHVPTK